MVWCIANNFDYKSAETLFLLRNPLLEYVLLKKKKKKGNNFHEEFPWIMQMNLICVELRH